MSRITELQHHEILELRDKILSSIVDLNTTVSNSSKPDDTNELIYLRSACNRLSIYLGNIIESRHDGRLY
jgi:hypothetical protein